MEEAWKMSGALYSLVWRNYVFTYFESSRLCVNLDCSLQAERGCFNKTELFFTSAWKLDNSCLNSLFSCNILCKQQGTDNTHYILILYNCFIQSSRSVSIFYPWDIIGNNFITVLPQQRKIISFLACSCFLSKYCQTTRQMLHIWVIFYSITHFLH